jgi:hypothetical protein
MNKRSMVRTIREETKKKAKERPKDIQLARSTKKKKELVYLVEVISPTTPACKL